MSRFLPFVLVWALVSACDRPNFGTPVDAYLSFVKAGQKGDTKTAFEALTEATRQELTQRAKSVEAASGGAVDADPAGWFFARSGRVAPVDKVELVEQATDTATVRVTTGSGTQVLTLRKESGAWRVDLLPMLPAQRQGQTTP